MSELISIIVPVYNVERYFKACIESIIKQTYKNIEIILVDDGATDKSGQMCDYYAKTDNRIKVIHKKNGGLSDARNHGIDNASGKYLMFIDSDDVVSSDLVEYLYRFYQKYDADIAICDPVHCYPNQEIIFEPATLEKVYDSERATVEMLYQKSFLVAAWGKLYKREYFKDIIFPVGMLFEDSAIMYKIFDKAKTIVYGNAKLYGYMHREGSITTNSFSKKDCDILTICNHLIEYMSDRSEQLQRASRAYQTAAAFRIYLNAPRNSLFDKEIQMSEKILNNNLKSVMRDCKTRQKLKLALLLYKYSKPLMPLIYKKVDRWK